MKISALYDVRIVRFILPLRAVAAGRGNLGHARCMDAVCAEYRIFGCRDENSKIVSNFASGIIIYRYI